MRIYQGFILWHLLCYYIIDYAFYSLNHVRYKHARMHFYISNIFTDSQIQYRYTFFIPVSRTYISITLTFTSITQIFTTCTNLLVNVCLLLDQLINKVSQYLFSANLYSLLISQTTQQIDKNNSDRIYRLCIFILQIQDSYTNSRRMN